MSTINGINSNLYNGTTTGASQSSSGGNMFLELLSGYMGSQAASIGGFSDSSSSGGSMGGLLGGTGGYSSLLGGMGSSDSSMMLMLMMILLSQQKSGSTGTTSQCQHYFVDSYQNAAQQGIPGSSWLPSNPSLTNHVGERSARAYANVIDQFGVETNERYRVNKNGTGDTYCNIFAWDVTRAMGAEIPHFINAATGVPMASAGANVKELDANGVNDWLNSYGATYGWRKATPEEAQQYANAGMPAVTSWKNPSGHGHLQVVRPSADGTYDQTRGVAIAQAGRQLIRNGYCSDAYSNETMSQIDYFVHI